MTKLDRIAELLIQGLKEQTMPLTESEKLKLVRAGDYTRFTRTLQDRYGRNRVLVSKGRRNGALYLTAIKQSEREKNIKSATIVLTGIWNLDKDFLIESVLGLEKIFKGVTIDPETQIGAVQLESLATMQAGNKGLAI